MKEHQEKQVLKRPPRRWPRYVLCVVIIVVVALFVASLARSKYGLVNSEYEITSSKIAAQTGEVAPDATQPEADVQGLSSTQVDSLRIVELADLHNAVFGENNSRLVEMVRAQDPDLILMVGDMVQGDEEDLTVVTNLIKALSDTAPIYFSIGNHEEEYIKNFPGRDLVLEIEAAGATVLDKTYEDIEIKETQIRIGGIYGYCLPGTEELRKEFANQPERIAEMDWLLEYQDTDRLKLLMCHMPVCWMQNGSQEFYDVDVIFAGHAHGGQVRLPFVGGLYAPDQGWFVGKEEGLYPEKTDEAATSTLVLSRGLGSEMKIPRFCNTPQVVTVEIEATSIKNEKN